MSPNSRARSLLAIFLLVFFLRGTALFLDTRSFDRDPEHYRQLARALRSEGTLGNDNRSTASRFPLYPAMLAAVSYCSRPHPSATGIQKSTPSLWGSHLLLSPNASVALLHWVLGVATVVLLFRTAQELSLPEWIACLCALMTAADPILLHQSRLVLPDTAIVFFAVTTIFTLLSAQRHTGLTQGILFFIAGLCCGCGALLHWFFLPLGAMTVISLPIVSRFQSGENRAFYRPTLLFLAAVAIVLLPWGVKNKRNFGTPFLMTSRAGFSLYLGNNPSRYDAEKENTHFDEDMFVRQWEEHLRSEYTRREIPIDSPQAEVFQNKYAATLAKETICRRPVDFLRAIGKRMATLWQVVPKEISETNNEMNNISPKAADQIRTGIGLFYGVEFLLAALGLVKLLLKAGSKRPYPIGWLWPLITVTAFAMIYLFFPAEIYARELIQPVIALFAGVFLVREKTRELSLRNGERSSLPDITP